MPLPSTLRIEPPKERWFAVLIGIRYLRHENKNAHLVHTHEDVDVLKKLLLECGYPEKNIKVLADREDVIRDREGEFADWEGDIDPTRVNIISAIHWLVQRAVNDPDNNYKMLWYYAGHGDQEPDPKKREKDLLNEAIIPVDAKFDMMKTSARGSVRQFKVIPNAEHDKGYIIDDDLNIWMAQPLPAGNRLMALFDCCHSGTSLDLKHEYVAKAVPWLYHRFFRATLPRLLKPLLEKRKKAVVPDQTSQETPKALRSQTMPGGVNLGLNRALELGPDNTLAAGVDIVVTTSRWTFSGADWAWRKLFSRVSKTSTIATLPGAQDGAQVQDKSTVKVKRVWSALGTLHGLFHSDKRYDYRAVAALQIEAMNCVVETASIETVLHISEYVRETDDSEFVAADVMALGACSDDQLAPDSRSLAKSLAKIYKNYGRHLTYAELLLCLSRTARPQIPELSSSREMTERWGDLFIL
ncbi:hypothetical protein CALVIDRAFT_266994 [Calocera viscosa TUFC12733]|uniref:Peptidase C14 caspase domain-containing protein n=1 Tax=Calocera viscosa (strain TUFC12733) TaxID=1330018 RepID=A0A167IXN7_CALVF|nr:hypothetical protein CALVIDRAFT_266994 [Calocera viscosa TUFC12733]